jgi:hypothetical protein
VLQIVVNEKGKKTKGEKDEKDEGVRFVLGTPPCGSDAVGISAERRNSSLYRPFGTSRAGGGISPRLPPLLIGGGGGSGWGRPPLTRASCRLPVGGQGERERAPGEGP